MSITRMREGFSHFGKPLLLVIAAVFVIGAVAMFGGNQLSNSDQNAQADQVVATVNGLSVTKGELIEAQAAQFRQMGSAPNLSPLQNADMLVNIMNQMLFEKLKLSAARQQGLGLGWLPWEVNRERNRIVDEQINYVREMASQGKKIKPSDAEIDAMLKRMNPPSSLAQMRKDAAKELTKDKVKDYAAIRMLEDKARAKVAKVDDNKIKEVYQQFNIRQIVIRETGMPGAQTERRANEVLKKLQSGEDFAKVAREFSDDPATKSKGGEVGWIPAIQDQDLQGLSKGKLSGVIKSPMYGGYRIVYVEDVKTELPKDYALRKAEYQKGIQQAYEQQEVQKMYMEIQSKSKIDIKDTELKGYWLAARINMAPSAAERNRAIDEAIGYLEKANAKGDNLVKEGPHSKMAELYLAKGDSDKALKLLDQIVNTQNIYASDLSLMLGKLYMKKGDNAKAIKQFELAGDVGYGDQTVQTELISLWKKVGQPERAAKIEKKVEEQKRVSGQQESPAGAKTTP